MSTPQEYRRVADELAALRAAIEALVEDLSEYNPRFGDYTQSARLLRALLDPQ